MRRVPGRAQRSRSAFRAVPAAALAVLLAGPGLGCADMANTAAVISDAVLKNQVLKQQQDSARGEAAFVQVTATRAEYDQNRQPVLRVQLRNGSRYAVSGVALVISYLNGGNVLAQDTSCAGQTSIGSGQFTILTCRYATVRGATNYRVDVATVRFQ